MIKIAIPASSLKILKRMEKAVPKLKAKGKDLSVIFAQEYARKLRTNIKDQVLGHKQLSNSWTTYKAKHGLDPRILIATGKYLRSIRSYRTGDGAKVQSSSEYGILHEFGSGKLPARPHWIPTLLMMQVEKKLVTKIEKQLLDVFTRD